MEYIMQNPHAFKAKTGDFHCIWAMVGCFRVCPHVWGHHSVHLPWQDVCGNAGKALGSTWKRGQGTLDTGHFACSSGRGEPESRKGTGLLLGLWFWPWGSLKRSWKPPRGPRPLENYWIKNRIIWAIGLCTDLEPKSKILMVILDFSFPFLISPRGTCLTLRRVGVLLLWWLLNQETVTGLLNNSLNMTRKTYL